MHFGNEFTDRRSARRSISSGCSSPIRLDQSLFTPPPPLRRRARLSIDYLEVPPFPNGLTKADYQPMTGYSVTPLPDPTITNQSKPSTPAESPIMVMRTPPPRKWKGKERECDIASSRENHERRVAPPNWADATPNQLLNAFYEPTEIPLYEDDIYPPLTTVDLATNTRFQFAHAWRAHESQLRKAEPNCTFDFKIHASIWAQSMGTSSPRLPGTTGCVSIEELRSWELVPQEKCAEPVSDEQAHASNAVISDDPNHLLLPDDALPVPTVAVDSALSNSIVAQAFSSATVDTDHDIDQFFNGLNDSPDKPVPSPTHAFRPRLLQSAGRADVNSFELTFPSLDLDCRLTATSSHECFLGVPPSPNTADMGSSRVPAPTPDPPFNPVSFMTASPSDAFPADAWTFEQGDHLLGDNSPLSNDVLPTALGTINPSLLGPEQPQTASLERKHTAVRRRSKLPEPVIYIRRPVDSSTLPLVSGKRPIQIKYRDSGGSPTTPSTPTMSNAASSNPVTNPVELSNADMDDSPPAKRRSTPSQQPRESHIAPVSDSDYIPETSKPKIKVKVKQPSVKDKGTLAESQGSEAETAPTMSFCHQCRNRTARPKMLCSNTIDGRVCGKRFCNRCILYRLVFRYLDI